MTERKRLKIWGLLLIALAGLPQVALGQGNFDYRLDSVGFSGREIHIYEYYPNGELFSKSSLYDDLGSMATNTDKKTDIFYLPDGKIDSTIDYRLQEYNWEFHFKQNFSYDSMGNTTENSLTYFNEEIQDWNPFPFFSCGIHMISQA